jgi:hypothetical protein
MKGQKELKKVKATHTALRNGFVTQPKAPTIVTQSVLLRRCFITTFCFCLLIPLLISVTPLWVVETPLRLVIIGDSTVCEYSSEHASCGWGQYVPVKRTSDHCKAAEFPMKACWKEDAQAVASEPQNETVIENVTNFLDFCNALVRQRL